MLSSWNYEGEFLKRFAGTSHNMVTQLFLRAIRSGETKPFDVIAYVGNVCFNAYQNNEEWDSFPSSEIRILLESLDCSEIKEFACFLIEREALPASEKVKLKSRRNLQIVSNAMASEPPTEKQMKYLKSLRCETVPTTKLEASQLIDQCLKAKGEAA